MAAQGLDMYHACCVHDHAGPEYSEVRKLREGAGELESGRRPKSDTPATQLYELRLSTVAE
jgi:hypothetical protein